MARRVKIEIGALNIRIHPHPEGTYERFIKAIYKAKQPIRLRGDRTAVIRSLISRPDSDDHVQGVISTYLDIDIDQPWFNDSTFDEATEEDLENVSLPRHLHPNVHSFLFILDTKNHKIYFEKYAKGRVLTPQSALKFFEDSANLDVIKSEFGNAKITLVQSSFGLNEVFKIDRVTEVRVFIEKPNDIWPDDFEEHLGQKNARSVTVTYKSDPGEGIVRDQELDELTETSLENGYTEVSGYGATGHQTFSTRSFPKTAQDKFDQDSYTEVSMIKSLIAKFKKT
jgi:hypothetical protein